jgi:hypothetical protein
VNESDQNAVINAARYAVLIRALSLTTLTSSKSIHFRLHIIMSDARYPKVVGACFTVESIRVVLIILFALSTGYTLVHEIGKGGFSS